MVSPKQKKDKISKQTKIANQYNMILGAEYKEKQNYNLTNVNTEEKFQLEACELHNNGTHVKLKTGSDMEQGQAQEVWILVI